MKKNEDIVAGRLSAAFAAKAGSADDTEGNTSDYGAGRLGISSETEPQTPERQEQTVLSGEEAPSRQPEPAPWGTDASRPYAPSPLSEISLQDRILRLAHNRRAVTLAGGAVGLLILGLVWLFIGGGDTTTSPQSARAANSPGIGAPARPPAAGVPEVPGRSARGDLPGESTSQPALANGQAATSPAATKPSVEITEVPETQPVVASKPPVPKPVLRYRDCPPGFTLSGIIRAPNGLLANINGTFVAVGDKIKRARVIEIKDYAVEMELKGERFMVGFSFSSDKSTNRDDDSDEE